MNISGKDGKLEVGSSDLADCKNISFTIQANNSNFAHSGSAGHQVNVKGILSASGKGDMVLDTEDEIYDRLRPGDTATLNVYENATRNWIFPMRVSKMDEEVNIGEGGEITVGFEWESNGRWTYPDGTQSTS